VRLCIVHPHDVPYTPWVTRMLRFAEALAGLGHAVQLVYFRDPERRRTSPRLRTSWPPGLETHELELPRLGLGATIRRVADLARGSDYICFFKCMPQASLTAIAAALQHRCPVHYDWEDYETQITRRVWTEKIGRPSVLTLGVWMYEALLPRLVDSMSASSRLLLDKVVQSGRFPPERICFAPACADTEKFRPDLDPTDFFARVPIRPPYVVYVGTLEGLSNVDLLLQAAARLRPRLPDVSYLVIGDGWQRPALERLAADLGLEDRVVFAGYLPHDLIPLAVAGADAAAAFFEMNSAMAGKSPLKIIEYMAGGKVVVSNPCGDVPQMLDGCGVLSDSLDPGALAAALELGLTAPEIRATYPARARARVLAEYSPNVIARRFERTFRHVLAG
jgi:glycosyltransferase involved in cell wall biosynthesis